ncbi:Uncharacterized protein Fot_14440 [Forsythia ovata]|uniref:Uncharacterized protein n=1 Tax=Forsythia ovata TaxID=205694 RepID=A0ABD1W6M6_9LAMI
MTIMVVELLNNHGCLQVLVVAPDYRLPAALDYRNPPQHHMNYQKSRATCKFPTLISHQESLESNVNSTIMVVEQLETACCATWPAVCAEWNSKPDPARITSCENFFSPVLSPH